MFPTQREGKSIAPSDQRSREGSASTNFLFTTRKYSERTYVSVGIFRRMSARPENIRGRISEQKSEKSCYLGFQAFDDSEGEFSLSQKTAVGLEE